MVYRAPPAADMAVPRWKVPGWKATTVPAGPAADTSARVQAWTPGAGHETTLAVSPAGLRVPVGPDRELSGAGAGHEMRGPQLLGHVGQVEENLQLLITGPSCRDQGGVVQVVAMQGLVVLERRPCI